MSGRPDRHIEILPSALEEQHQLRTLETTMQSEIQRKNGNIILCVQIFTIALLIASLLRVRTRTPRSADFAIWILSPTLQYLHQPILALSLTVGYLAWTHLPDSYDDVDSLPSHAEFIRDLQLLPPKDPPEECVICWDTEHPIAELQCTHRGCKQCLELMGPLQTACPVCRKPLFSGDDWLVLLLSKFSGSVTAVNITIIVFEAVHRVYTLQYIKACLSLALIAWHVWLGWKVFHAVRHDPNWWRIPPGRQNLSNLCYGCLFSTFVLSSALWNWSEALGES